MALSLRFTLSIDILEDVDDAETFKELAPATAAFETAPPAGALETFLLMVDSSTTY